MHGDGLGQKYGFPTANIELEKKEFCIREGVYAALGLINNTEYKVALAVRKNPWKVEAHVIDFEGDLYGSYIAVEPIQKVSEFELYDSDDELIAKIRQDVEIVREILQKK